MRRNNSRESGRKRITASTGEVGKSQSLIPSILPPSPSKKKRGPPESMLAGFRPAKATQSCPRRREGSNCTPSLDPSGQGSEGVNRDEFARFVPGNRALPRGSPEGFAFRAQSQTSPIFWFPTLKCCVSTWEWTNGWFSAGVGAAPWPGVIGRFDGGLGNVFQADVADTPEINGFHGNLP